MRGVNDSPYLGGRVVFKKKSKLWYSQNSEHPQEDLAKFGYRP
jgi:hypothetical protein